MSEPQFKVGDRVRILHARDGGQIRTVTGVWGTGRMALSVDGFESPVYPDEVERVEDPKPGPSREPTTLQVGDRVRLRGDPPNAPTYEIASIPLTAEGWPFIFLVGRRDAFTPSALVRAEDPAPAPSPDLDPALARAVFVSAFGAAFASGPPYPSAEEAYDRALTALSRLRTLLENDKEIP